MVFEAVEIAVGLGEQRLEAVEGREALDLDELWLDAAIGVLDEAEIDLHEERFGVFMGNAELGGDGYFRLLTIGRCLQLFDEFAARCE